MRGECRKPPRETARARTRTALGCGWDMAAAPWEDDLEKHCGEVERTSERRRGGAGGGAGRERGSNWEERRRLADEVAVWLHTGHEDLRASLST